ncbi:MAG: hypothetical protein GY861_20840 [bacterium]|nr:hypothetical protein [bacterium]
MLWFSYKDINLIEDFIETHYPEFIEEHCNFMSYVLMRVVHKTNLRLAAMLKRERKKSVKFLRGTVLESSVEEVIKSFIEDPLPAEVIEDEYMIPEWFPRRWEPDETFVPLRKSLLSEVIDLSSGKYMYMHIPDEILFNLQNHSIGMKVHILNAVGDRKIVGAPAALKSKRTVFVSTDPNDNALDNVFPNGVHRTAYFSLTTSSTRLKLRIPELCIKIVKDGEFGTGDGMGIVGPRLAMLLSSHGYYGFIQVRMLTDNGKKVIWKGTESFKMSVGSLDSAPIPIRFDNVGLIAPDSMLKGCELGLGTSVFKDTIVSITEHMIPRKWRSSTLVTLHFSKEAVIKDILPITKESLEELVDLIGDPEKIAERFSKMLKEEEEGGNTDERYLSVLRVLSSDRKGILNGHPHVRNRIWKMLIRSTLSDIAKSGGIDFLPSANLIPSASLRRGRVCVPSMCWGDMFGFRYPVIPPMKVYKNIPIPELLHYPWAAVNPEDAVKDANDFDGDPFVGIDSKRFPNLIEEGRTWVDVDSPKDKQGARRVSPATNEGIAESMISVMSDKIGLYTVALESLMSLYHMEKISGLQRLMESDVYNGVDYPEIAEKYIVVVDFHKLRRFLQVCLDSLKRDVPTEVTAYEKDHFVVTIVTKNQSGQIDDSFALDVLERYGMPDYLKYLGSKSAYSISSEGELFLVPTETKIPLGFENDQPVFKLRQEDNSVTVIIDLVNEYARKLDGVLNSCTLRECADVFKDYVIWDKYPKTSEINRILGKERGDNPGKRKRFSWVQEFRRIFRGTYRRIGQKSEELYGRRSYIANVEFERMAKICSVTVTKKIEKRLRREAYEIADEWYDRKVSEVVGKVVENLRTWAEEQRKLAVGLGYPLTCLAATALEASVPPKDSRSKGYPGAVFHAFPGELSLLLTFLENGEESCVE